MGGSITLAKWKRRHLKMPRRMPVYASQVYHASSHSQATREFLPSRYRVFQVVNVATGYVTERSDLAHLNEDCSIGMAG